MLFTHSVPIYLGTSRQLLYATLGPCSTCLVLPGPSSKNSSIHPGKTRGELTDLCTPQNVCRSVKYHLRFMTTIERVALVPLACEGRQLCLVVSFLATCNQSFVGFTQLVVNFE